jgi:hypothetical protein
MKAKTARYRIRALTYDASVDHPMADLLRLFSCAPRSDRLTLMLVAGASCFLLLSATVAKWVAV